MQVYKILPIYILNFEVEELIMDPVLEVRRGIRGVFFEKKIEEEIDFVELLSLWNLLIKQATLYGNNYLEPEKNYGTRAAIQTKALCYALWP